jgi:hypothetical protein
VNTDLPHGFAARPELAALTASVRCPRCPPAGPCGDCLDIMAVPVTGVCVPVGTVHGTYAGPADDPGYAWVDTDGTRYTVLASTVRYAPEA